MMHPYVLVAMLFACVFVAVAAGPALLSSRASRRGWFLAHTAGIDALPSRQLPFWIALAAGTGLFIELLIIRLHGSYFHLFGYFKNVSLLSCFLGLGVGYARGGIRPLTTPLVLPLLALQVALMYALRQHPVAGFLMNPVPEHAAPGMWQADTPATRVAVYAFLVLVFYFNALCFVPLGQLASRLMSRSEKLPAYGYNLIGSLAGILVFSAAAFLSTPPTTWLLLAGLFVMMLLWPQPKDLLSSAGCLLAVVVLLQVPLRLYEYDLYSPYQRLSLDLSDQKTLVIETGNSSFQRIHDMRPGKVTNEEEAAWRAYYDFPFQLKEQAGRVLIVGAGTGNDVAAALRSGAKAVDAVEIDPVILRLGRQLHPEKPYQANNVNVVLDDARAVLRRSKETYDLIVYGLLDSHVLLSSHTGGIRLDSYVYTLEGLRDARRRLTGDGIISLTFSLMSEEMGRKLFLMLQEAFDGEAPKIYSVGYAAGYAFVAGPGLASVQGKVPSYFVDQTESFALADVKVDAATDDWPFFYMSARRYPASYLIVVGVLLAACALFLRQLAPRESGRWSFPCFFLGAGFMLVETKGVTELALAFSNTWVVVSAVIAGILAMAFLANWWVNRNGAPRAPVVYVLLGASLALGYAMTFADLSFLGSTATGVFMTGVLSLPIFFSGLAFSSELSRSDSVASALASNLLGAMVGGLLEYNAMFFGYRALYVMAFALYLGAWATTSSRWSLRSLRVGA